MNLPVIVTAFKIFFRVKGGILGPLVLLLTLYLVEGSFWQGLIDKSPTIADYHHLDLLFYSLTSLTIFQITSVAGDPDSLSGHIENGSLTMYLLNPCPYLERMLSIQIAAIAARSLVFLPLLFLILWFVGFPFSANQVLGLVAILPLAGLLNFLINSIISMLSFWLNGSYAFVQIKETLFWVLSGALIPLDFLPIQLSSILKFFPPAYVVYFPARIFIGKEDFWPIASGSIGSLAIFFTVYGLIMGRGLVKFQSHGG
ncbi:MAG: hypothetical protein EOP48_00720 [Sphingobacteriales bacterium]|nr:MAG: hypothetical protein EOP48_00720 [Sphingobacteriales bacterium]